MNDVFSDPKKGLSYFWSVVSAVILGYIVYRWGNEKEILTLIIGLIGGTILGGIMGLWFGGTNNKHTTTTTDPNGTTTTAEINVTQTVPEAPTEEPK